MAESSVRCVTTEADVYRQVSIGADGRLTEAIAQCAQQKTPSGRIATGRRGYWRADEPDRNPGITTFQRSVNGRVLAAPPSRLI